jgi:hypothetical protein
MELEDACVSANREISGFHAEVSRMIGKLDQLAANSEGRENLVPEIRGLCTAVEDLDRKIDELERQLFASSRFLSEDIPWYDWI